MHALIVSHHFLPHVGGVEILVDYEIRALLSAGHHITLVTSNGTGGTHHPAYPDSVRIVRVKAWHVLERYFNLPYPLFSPSLIRHLWREIGRCDVTHIHGFMFHSSLIAALLGRLRGKKIILTEHGGMQQFDSKVKSLLARLGVETVGRITVCCADRLVTYNTRITRLLERLTHRCNSTLFLPNPVDTSIFRKVGPGERDQLRKELGWPSTRQKVLFVGRLTAEKGVPQLLECIAHDYDIVFCGSGDPSILGSLPRSGIAYLPPQSQADLAKLYQAADVLIVPSKVRESFPLVVQEALICGLKVVLGYDEGFEPYRTIAGLSFCKAQSYDMRQAILAALQDLSGWRSSQTAVEFFPSPECWIQRLYEGMDPVVTANTGKGTATKLPPCLYCARTSYERYYANIADRLGHVPGRWEYWRCTYCGSATLAPFPKPSDLAAYYPPVYSFCLELGHESMLKQLLAKIEYLCYFKPQYEAQVRRVLSGVEWSGEKNLRLLDVGCGRGLRLHAFQRHGFAVQGVDIQSEVVQYLESALGISAICADLETISRHFPAQTFDVITAFFVLEHVTDVQAVLRNCYRILKPGGWFVTAVPFLDSVQSRLFKERWINVTEAPRHVSLPTFEGIRQACRRSGYDRVFIRPDSALNCAGQIGASLFPSCAITHVYQGRKLGKVLTRLVAGTISICSLPLILAENYLCKQPSLGLVFAYKPTENQQPLVDVSFFGASSV